MLFTAMREKVSLTAKVFLLAATIDDREGKRLDDSEGKVLSEMG